MTTSITVIDSIMGSGKTTYLHDYINCVQSQNYIGMQDEVFQPSKFLVVVPLLSEVDRIKSACPTLHFKDPQPIQGRKLYGLKSLIKEGENVSTTHSLFSMIDREVYALLKASNYTLVIDEVITCVDLLDTLSKPDRRTLFEGGFVYVEESTEKLRWNHHKHPDYRGRFDDIRGLCDNGNLVVYRPKALTSQQADSSDKTVLLWEFPSDFLSCFKSVFILTYLFEGSPMRAYLDGEKLSFTKMAIENGELIDWSKSNELAIKANLRKLISIYEGPMNAVGKRDGKGHPLSASWYTRATPQALKRLQSSTTRFFGDVVKTPSALNGWVTFNKAKRFVSGKGFAKGFIPVNAKATNKYIDKRSLAYHCNIFQHPVIRGFFEDQGIAVNEEQYALSELLQWVWRSGIRRGEPINLFIPSERMRGLFTKWIAQS